MLTIYIIAFCAGFFLLGILSSKQPKLDELTHRKGVARMNMLTGTKRLLPKNNFQRPIKGRLFKPEIYPCVLCLKPVNTYTP